MARQTRDGAIPLLILAALLLSIATPLGAQGTSSDAGGATRIRFEASIGFQSWSALAGLNPATGGGFRENGLGLGGSVHWAMGESERSHILLGLDVYAHTHESDVFHVSNDVQFRSFQLTPSVKFSFDRPSGPRYLLGIGLGYYEADITELSAYWWGQQTERELWQESATGGYVSLDVEFPRRQRESDNGFFFAARIHSVDFGRVSDQRFAGPESPTLGANAGNLSGPLTVIHFGYQWLH